MVKQKREGRRAVGRKYRSTLLTFHHLPPKCWEDVSMPHVLQNERPDRVEPRVRGGGDLGRVGGEEGWKEGGREGERERGEGGREVRGGRGKCDREKGYQ